MSTFRQVVIKKLRLNLFQPLFAETKSVGNDHFKDEVIVFRVKWEPAGLFH